MCISILFENGRYEPPGRQNIVTSGKFLKRVDFWLSADSMRLIKRNCVSYSVNPFQTVISFVDHKSWWLLRDENQPFALLVYNLVLS